MYAFQSGGSRKPLHAMVAGAVLCAAILFSISNREGMAMPHLYQMGAILCLTAAVYLAGRYSLREYRYEVILNGVINAVGEEQYDLVITEIVGKRQTVVSRVSLRDIDHAAVMVVSRRSKAPSKEAPSKEAPSKEAPSKEAPSKEAASKEAAAALCKGKRVFRYENTPISPASCYIPVPEENSVVIIPVDARMVEILKRQ